MYNIRHMRQLVYLFILLVGVIALAAWVSKPGNLTQLLNQPGSLATPSPTFTTTKTVKVGNTQFNAEIAKTPKEREIGLSGRDKMDDNSGMLFVFDRQNTRPTFWMKNVKFPLDLLWINDGKVVQIHKNLMPIPAGTPDNQIKLYSPNQSVDYVLEILGGKSEQAGIKAGDSVEAPSL